MFIIRFENRDTGKQLAKEGVGRRENDDKKCRNMEMVRITVKTAGKIENEIMINN